MNLLLHQVMGDVFLTHANIQEFYSEGRLTSSANTTETITGSEQPSSQTQHTPSSGP